MDMQMMAMSEMTKQIQGSMMRVNSDELNESASRQSQITQNETNNTPNNAKRPNVNNFVHTVNLQNKFSDFRYNK